MRLIFNCKDPVVTSWFGTIEVWIIVIAVITALNVLVRMVPIVRYARLLQAGAQRPTPTATRWPHTVFFVPIRGGGEQSRTVLEHLLALDYPSFEVRVILDHPSDPAYPFVSALCQERNDPRLQVEFLREPATNRSLNCSALLQFLDRLDKSCELVGFCAGDMQFPRSYLREMAGPMLDPEVGSTLGNRWYQPQPRSWGSLVRYVWNAAAVVFMWIDEQPWAGSSVLRPNDIQRSGLRETWATGMVEDAPIKAAIRNIGLRMAFVPKLLVISSDELSLRACYEFIKRQFLWTRLYHPNWPLVPVSILSQALVTFLPWLVAIPLAAVGEFRSAALLATIGFIFWCCELTKLVVLDRAARKIAEMNGQPIPITSLGLWSRLFLVIPLTQIVNGLAVVACARLNRVQWSGIEYEIHRSGSVRRLNYFPVSKPPA
jgi:hypothetical protein